MSKTTNPLQEITKHWSGIGKSKTSQNMTELQFKKLVLSNRTTYPNNLLQAFNTTINMLEAKFNTYTQQTNTNTIASNSVEMYNKLYNLHPESESEYAFIDTTPISSPRGLKTLTEYMLIHNTLLCLRKWYIMYASHIKSRRNQSFNYNEYRTFVFETFAISDQDLEYFSIGRNPQQSLREDPEYYLNVVIILTRLALSSSMIMGNTSKPIIINKTNKDSNKNMLTLKLEELQKEKINLNNYFAQNNLFTNLKTIFEKTNTTNTGINISFDNTKKGETILKNNFNLNYSKNHTALFSYLHDVSIIVKGGVVESSRKQQFTISHDFSTNLDKKKSKDDITRMRNIYEAFCLHLYYISKYFNKE